MRVRLHSNLIKIPSICPSHLCPPPLYHRLSGLLHSPFFVNISILKMIDPVFKLQVYFDDIFRNMTFWKKISAFNHKLKYTSLISWWIFLQITIKAVPIFDFYFWGIIRRHWNAHSYVNNIMKFRNLEICVTYRYRIFQRYRIFHRIRCLMFRFLSPYIPIFKFHINGIILHILLWVFFFSVVILFACFVVLFCGGFSILLFFNPIFSVVSYLSHKFLYNVFSCPD